MSHVVSTAATAWDNHIATPAPEPSGTIGTNEPTMLKCSA